ncbi:MAG: LPS assembly lipoprotein LptE [Gammaproteobacteria bacterium]
MRIAMALMPLKPFQLIFSGLLMLGFMLTQVSCGFHLRGAYVLPESMSSTYVKASQQNSELVRHLKRTLKASDIALVESELQATAILDIGGEKQDKRVLSVDSKGLAREYALSYEINFELRSAQGQLELERQTLKLTRDFLFDTEDVLGKGREEAILVRDMQQDMVRLMMLRLSRHKNTGSPCQGAGCQQGDPSQ